MTTPRDNEAPTPEDDEHDEGVVEQVERKVRDRVDRGLDQVGLPSTRRLEELARDATEEIGRRIPLPDTGALGDDLRRRTDWLDRQLKPIGDRFEPVRDRIDDELRRHKDRPETENEEDDDEWGVIESQRVHRCKTSAAGLRHPRLHQDHDHLASRSAHPGK